MFYDKKIKYVDVYENGEKVQNAGFVRMEAKENKAKLWIQVSGLRATDTMKCPVVLLSGERDAVLGEMTLERGKGVAEFAGLDVDDMAGGIGYEELEEIHIRPAGTRLLRCIVQQHVRSREVLLTEEETKEAGIVVEDVADVRAREPEKVVRPESVAEEVHQESTAEGVEEIPEMSVTECIEEVPQTSVEETTVENGNKAEVQEKVEVKSEAELLKEAFLAEKRLREGESAEPIPQNVTAPEIEAKEERPETPSEKSISRPKRPMVMQDPQPMDKWQQLLAIYPHIRPFEDRREYLLMKPQDFVVLTDKYFPLSGNSFLLHGYYNYDHLIMSKERRPEGERFYIGVPGNFYDKEKQVAIMFGFESFEGKREPARTGDFGYYLIPVEI